MIVQLLTHQMSIAQRLRGKDKYDWDIKAYDIKSCANADQVLSSSKLFLEKKGDDIYLFAPDPKPLINLITNDKDAIAVEKVFLSSYVNDTSQLGRNKGRSIFNGKVMRPVGRTKLYEDLADHFRMTPYDRKALHERAKPTPYWMTYLGKDTLSGEGPYEYNILIIKNSSLCAVKYHRNQAGQHHEFYDGVQIQPEWPDKELRILPILKTFSFQVPFDRNATIVTDEGKSLYTDVLDDFIVRGVKIWAYASVEGNADLNEKLQKERALYIQNSLQKHLPEQVKYRIIAKENWERFAEQLEGTEQDSLQQFSKEEVKELLKKEDNLSAFNHLLYDQRKAVIKVFYNTKPQDYDTVHIIQHNFRQALDSIKGRKKAGRTYSYYVRDAEGLYSWLYTELQKGKISEGDFMKWTFPLDPTYHKMINNQFWYQYYHKDVQTPMMENYIKLVGLDREASDVERFNLISYALEKEHNGTNASGLALEDLGRLMRSRAYHNLPRENVLKVAIPLFAKLAVHYNHDFTSWDRRNLMLNDLMTLFDQDSTREDTDWLRLAELSAHLGNSFVSNEIIDRFEGSELFRNLDLKLNYDHSSVTSNEFDSNSYYTDLMSRYGELGKKNWCGLLDAGGLSFQAMDNEDVHQLYLSNCRSNLSP